MSKKRLLLSIIETPAHPNFSKLYQHYDLIEARVNSIRKANAQIKKEPPDIIIAEFLYAYSTNYSGVQISNLDVMLITKEKYAPEAKIVVFVDKTEYQYIGKLTKQHPLTAIMVFPLKESSMVQVLNEINGQ